MEVQKETKKLINISKRTFIAALSMLIALLILAIIFTYIIPKGQFGTQIVDGKEVIDYTQYIKIEDEKGINILKGIFAPILILGSSDGISVIILSIFLLVIAGAFQGMSDSLGIKVIINRIVKKFKNKKFLLLAMISLIFMAFGSLLGLFEEMLTLLPIMVILALSLGYDSFTGFLISIVSCGFGFSTAITNPFTVIFASNIIGANPVANIWFRIITFIVMYGLMLLVIFLYNKKISKNKEKSLTYEKDLNFENDMNLDENIPNEKIIFNTYVIFFSVVLFVTILFSALNALRDYTIIALIVVFLFGGNLAAYISFNKDFKKMAKSFLSGLLSALPTIAFILLASSVKYVLVEGHVLPTISHSINNLVQTENPYLLAAILFGIILFLEFFVSSSTAKAIFVMAILSVLNLGLTKETIVLIYTFADGYTNLLFPTSPVLLIGLSMVGVSYFKWLKKSWWLFVITFILALGFVALAILLHI